LQHLYLWERACSRRGPISRRISGVWNTAFASKLAPTGPSSPDGINNCAGKVNTAPDIYRLKCRVSPLWERACSRRGLISRHISGVWNGAFASKLAPTGPSSPDGINNCAGKVNTAPDIYRLKCRVSPLWERACSRRGLISRHISGVWNTAFASKLAPTGPSSPSVTAKLLVTRLTRRFDLAHRRCQGAVFKGAFIAGRH